MRFKIGKTLFSRIFIFSSIMVIIGAVSLSTIFILNDQKIINLRDDNMHYYTANFYVDDVLFNSETLIKGSYLKNAYEDVPTKDPEADGTYYQFMGWDITGDNIGDLLPPNIYFNFDAHAVFTPIKLPNIDFSNFDFYQLLQLLDDLNIDLESFLNFFGLSLEDILNLLKIDVFKYTTDYSGFAYFRNESFGKYDDKRYKWSNANFFDPSKYKSSLNPLNYAANKIKNIISPKSFDITYVKKGNNYPVLQYELSQTEELESDSVLLTKPENKSFSSFGIPYCPASSYYLNALSYLEYSSEEISDDERTYREYAYSNYLDINDDMRNFFEEISDKEGIKNFSQEGYACIDKITAFLKVYGYKCSFTMNNYPKNNDPVKYFMDIAKEGNSRHFASALTLWFRSLGIPARYAQGYVSYAQPGVENTVNALQAWSWTEIYVDNLGWLQFDPSLLCMDLENLSYLYNNKDPNDVKNDIDNNDFSDKTLISIKVVPDESEIVFYMNDKFKREKLKVIAYFDDGTEAEIPPLYVSQPDMGKVGKQKVLVTVSIGDVTKYGTYEIEIIQPKVIKITSNADENYSSVKKIYYLGDEFSDKELQVFAYYENNTKREINRGEYQITYPNMHKVGEQEVLISYFDPVSNKEFKTSYKITIKSYGVSKVEISTTKKTYIVGEEFTYEYLVIYLIYNNGDKKRVFFDKDSMKLCGFDSSKAGKPSIYVEYTDENGSTVDSNKLEITVKDKTEFSIDTSKIQKLSLVYKGETFSNDDLKKFISVTGLENGDSINFTYSIIGRDENKLIKNAGSYAISLEYAITNEIGKNVTENYKKIVLPKCRINVLRAKLTLNAGYYTDKSNNKTYSTVYKEVTNGSKEFYVLNENNEKIKISENDYLKKSYNAQGLVGQDTINNYLLTYDDKILGIQEIKCSFNVINNYLDVIKNYNITINKGRLVSL